MDDDDDDDYENEKKKKQDEIVKKKENIKLLDSMRILFKKNHEYKTD